jgi:hypothetical protein
MTDPKPPEGAANPWARPDGSDASFGGWVPPPPRPFTPAPAPPPARSARPWLPLGIAGGVVLVLGLVIVLVLATTGVFGDGARRSILNQGPSGPQPSLPPLAKLCPPTTQDPDPEGESLGPIAGPRLADADAGISYLQLGAPWQPWDKYGWAGGTLHVAFRVGYYFVTERYAEGDYLASVLSGKVPATVGDSLSLNLECAGRQVAEDVRREYYPRPNVKEKVRDEQVLVGGRPAWVSTFHLTFQAEGLQARGEQVAVVLVDVGRPNAAVLYISIPDTHKQWDAQIDRIIASIQPT